jgi:hypothetical protein
VASFELADLNISNIRIIKKIERLALIVGELLQPYDSQLRKEVIRSLTVLAWSIYSREDAPPIQFVLKRSYSQYLQNDKNAGFTEEEVAWNQVLNVYGFTHCDALDLVLIDGIQKGFFDEVRVTAEADKQQDRNDAHRAEAALTESWRLYHHSFESNEEVAQRLFNGAMENIKYLDLTDCYSIRVAKSWCTGDFRSFGSSFCGGDNRPRIGCGFRSAGISREATPPVAL